MAPTLPNGVVVPQEDGDVQISATGVAEMRTLGASVDAQLATKADQSTVDGLATDLATKASVEYVDSGLDGKSDVGHTHSMSEVEGLEDALWDRTERSLTADDRIDDLPPAMYYVASGADASALGLPTNQHGWLTIRTGRGTRRAEYRTIAWAHGEFATYENATRSDGTWGDWSSGPTFDVAYAGDGTWDVAETPLQALTDKGRLPTAAAAHAEQIARNIVDTSHLALDVDGTPFFQPGSMSLRLLQDIDGNPYFQETS